MSDNTKKLAKNFIKKFKLTVIDYHSLKSVAAKIGYTVIEFNSSFNNKDVEILVNNLSLSEAILKSRGFTYVSKDFRLMFINEDLNDEEKLLVISHELGHILCGHVASSPIIGKDVKDEFEANEFSHYLLKQNTFTKFKRSVKKHRKAVIATIAILCVGVCLLTVYSLIQNRERYKDNLYITSTGDRYHKKECIFIKNKTNVKKLTEEDFEKGIYIPCDMCLPDEN